MALVLQQNKEVTEPEPQGSFYCGSFYGCGLVSEEHGLVNRAAQHLNCSNHLMYQCSCSKKEKVTCLLRKQALQLVDKTQLELVRKGYKNRHMFL